MLSILLFGRNDNHGYNYPKRLALSLNCIAQVLSDVSDEILFVDYNSPNNGPTVIEAIQDTLTEQAKKRLRILRVRPFMHQKFRSSLPILEPVARNVALRKSTNKWVLSTNGDMIFVPEDENLTLTDIVSHLKEGFYTLPRFELPESFWEQALDRLDPARCISFLRQQSGCYHLNTVVRRDDFIRYDNPGDFQLMLREDLVRIGGFDEEMVHRWHVDSNLSKRMSWVYKESASLEKILKGYHCNHTQKIGALSNQKSKTNDWKCFVTEVKDPIANSHNNSGKPWGLADEEIEEIKLDVAKTHEAKTHEEGAHVHFRAVLENVDKPPDQPYELSIYPSPYNQLTYSSDRIFIYLADHLMYLPKNPVVAYVGYNTQVLHKLSAYLEKKEGVLLCLDYFEQTLPLNVKVLHLEEIIGKASLFIFDFGFDEKSEMGRFIVESPQGYSSARKKLQKILFSFFEVAKHTTSSTPIIGIQVSHTDFYVVFLRHLRVQVSSYITGITYGLLNKKPSFQTGSFKTTTKNALRYWVVRYLFKQADPIRRFVKWMGKT